MKIHKEIIRQKIVQLQLLQSKTLSLWTYKIVSSLLSDVIRFTGFTLALACAQKVEKKHSLAHTHTRTHTTFKMKTQIESIRIVLCQRYTVLESIECNYVLNWCVLTLASINIELWLRFYVYVIWRKAKMLHLDWRQSHNIYDAMNVNNSQREVFHEKWMWCIEKQPKRRKNAQWRNVKLLGT